MKPKGLIEESELAGDLRFQQLFQSSWFSEAKK